AHVVRDVAAQLEAEIALREEGRPRRLMLDPQRIEQVLSNLLSNALKYRREGTPIRIDLDWTSPDVVVSVTNETLGPRMSPDDEKRIFDRFGRIKADIARGIPGLGIGLYVSRRIVEAHRGTIAVDTSVEHEVTFRFTLP